MVGRTEEAEATERDHRGTMRHADDAWAHYDEHPTTHLAAAMANNSVRYTTRGPQ